ncbi:hypothetical protein M422DRAFT_65148 [Sphaerobolus stellatus SS14]|nr:hypothetical protein M422DRAFT_65148 [Sphaerobolus stellatus SS14]
MAITPTVRLIKPTEPEIEQLVQVLLRAFVGDILIQTMTDGVLARKRQLFRLSLRAAALEGAIFVVDAVGAPGHFTCVAVCFGPGTDFLGSEAQMALGGTEFFNEMSQKTSDWWKNYYGPKGRELRDKTLGEQGMTDSWWPILIATDPKYQRKGYGSVLVKAICESAKRDNTIAGLATTSEYNVRFYESLGFKNLGQRDISSSFGSWIGTIMSWEDKA